MIRTFRELFGVPIGLPAPKWMLEIGALFLRTETVLISKSRGGCWRVGLNSGFRNIAKPWQIS